MLESLELKKAFQQARQELANSLYREDAATRVMARLMKERDEARDALANIQATVGFAPAPQGQGDDGGMEVEGQEAEVEAEGPLVGKAADVFDATEKAYVSFIIEMAAAVVSLRYPLFPCDRTRSTGRV